MRIEEITMILFLLVVVPKMAVSSLDEGIWPLPEWPHATPSEMGLDESLPVSYTHLTLPTICSV